MSDPWIDTVVDLLRLTTPSLIGVGLGAFIVRIYFVKRANEASLVDHIVSNLEQLREIMLEYWESTDKTAEGKRKREILGHRIKGDLRATSSDCKFLCEKYCKRNLERVTELVLNLHDACTGGDFETNRIVDPQRYITIVNSINAVKSELYRRKI